MEDKKNNSAFSDVTKAYISTPAPNKKGKTDGKIANTICIYVYIVYISLCTAYISFIHEFNLYVLLCLAHLCNVCVLVFLGACVQCNMRRAQIKNWFVY